MRRSQILLPDKLAEAKRLASFVLISLAIAFLGFSIVKAQREQSNTFNISEATFNFSGPADALGAASFTSAGTHFTDLQVGNDFLVKKDAEFQATTTLQEVTFGSRFGEALSFAAAATTTPGGVAGITNTGDPKLCNRIEVDLATAGRGNVAFQLAAGTSTSATAWSASGGSLIASTTIAAGTTKLLDNSRNTGSFWGRSSTASSSSSWIWDSGASILVAFDENASGTASSTDYSNMTGGLYVTCHTR